MTVHSESEQFRALTTKDGWNRFVADDPPRPSRLGDRERRALSERERAERNTARRRYMTSSGIVMTEDFKVVLEATESRLSLNEYKASGRLGIIVSGEPGLGKTTTVQQIGKLHTRRRQHQSHPSGWAGNVAVVYVCVPDSSTHKTMMAQFAHYFGLPVNARTSQSALTASVADVMAYLRVELVIVDEIHNLNMNRTAGADSSDALKHLSEKCPATFVYVGASVETCGLLDGPRGEQIASRFPIIRTTAYSNQSKGKREEWDALLLGMEQALCLDRQNEGDILEHSAELFAHTGGRIARLAEALHNSAIHAINDGTERIPKDFLRRSTRAWAVPINKAAS